MPKLRSGMVLIIDNASFHKSTKIIKLLASVNCKVIFLPPYSPDYNPIEHYWTKVKNAIRRASETIENFYDATVQAVGELCNA